MAAPSGDIDAVVFGREFWILSAPWASANELPADTVLWGEDWVTLTGRGFTTGGVGFNANLQRGTVNVDQLFDPAGRPVTTRTITMETSFAELSPANINLASGIGTIETVAPGAGTRGHNDLVIGADISDQYNTWGADVKQPDGEAFRFIVYKGEATGSPNIRVTPEAAASTALQITALPDTSTTPTRIARVRDVLPAA